MTDALQMKPSLGGAIHAVDRKWGWFVALGIGEIILGGIASANLLAANLASVLVIGAAMLVAGIFQLIAAWPVIGLWLFGAMLVVDLIFQGWGFIAFGMALRARASRQGDRHVPV